MSSEIEDYENNGCNVLEQGYNTMKDIVFSFFKSWFNLGIGLADFIMEGNIDRNTFQNFKNFIEEFQTVNGAMLQGVKIYASCVLKELINFHDVLTVIESKIDVNLVDKLNEYENIINEVETNFDDLEKSYSTIITYEKQNQIESIRLEILGFIDNFINYVYENFKFEINTDSYNNFRDGFRLEELDLEDKRGSLIEIMIDIIVIFEIPNKDKKIFDFSEYDNIEYFEKTKIEDITSLMFDEFLGIGEDIKTLLLSDYESLNREDTIKLISVISSVIESQKHFDSVVEMLKYKIFERIIKNLFFQENFIKGSFWGSMNLNLTKEICDSVFKGYCRDMGEVDKDKYYTEKEFNYHDFRNGYPRSVQVNSYELRTGGEDESSYTYRVSKVSANEFTQKLVKNSNIITYDGFNKVFDSGSDTVYINGKRHPAFYFRNNAYSSESYRFSIDNLLTYSDFNLVTYEDNIELIDFYCRVTANNILRKIGLETLRSLEDILKEIILKDAIQLSNNLIKNMFFNGECQAKKFIKENQDKNILFFRHHVNESVIGTKLYGSKLGEDKMVYCSADIYEFEQKKKLLEYDIVLSSQFSCRSVYEREFEINTPIYTKNCLLYKDLKMFKVMFNNDFLSYEYSSDDNYSKSRSKLEVIDDFIEEIKDDISELYDETIEIFR